MTVPIISLVDAFRRIDDPRDPRGVRHGFHSILSLAFLGLLCRQTDFAGLERWAGDHWRTLKGPLGFTRTKPPHATTISRVIAKFSLEQFRAAFALWLVNVQGVTDDGVVAVDGKTCKQGRDADGDPIHMLNVFTHGLSLCLAQFPVSEGKPTEPQALKAALAELLEHYPFIRIFTADALFTQRSLAKVILESGRDFLFAVKDNQPGLIEALRTSFHDAESRPPDAETTDKKGAKFTTASFGSLREKRSTTSARRSRLTASS